MTSQSDRSASQVASDLVSAAGLPQAAKWVTTSGADDVYRSAFQVDAAAAASVAAATAAVGAVAAARTGRPQQATVDAMQVAAAFESERRITSPDWTRSSCGTRSPGTMRPPTGGSGCTLTSRRTALQRWKSWAYRRTAVRSSGLAANGPAEIWRTP